MLVETLPAGQLLSNSHYDAYVIMEAKQKYLCSAIEASSVKWPSTVVSDSGGGFSGNDWSTLKNSSLNALFTDLATLFQPSVAFDDDFLAPTHYSLRMMWELLDHAGLLVGRPFPAGTVHPDGDGGLRLEWIGKESELRLIVPATEAGRQYIFQEGPNGHGSDFTVSPQILAEHLKVFSEHERLA